MIAARANPFRVSRVHRLRYRLSDAGWASLLDRLARLRHRAALVGPRGSGKTTLLEEIEGRLEAGGWRILRLRLRAERADLTPGEWRRVSRTGPGELVSLDGAEQLGWWRWRRLERLSRRAGGLLVTTHQPGRLPCLHRHRTRPELLIDLVRDLVGDAAALALRPHLERLFEIHRGNLRDCLRSLYDQWGQPTPLSIPTQRGDCGYG